MKSGKQLTREDVENGKHKVKGNKEELKGDGEKRVWRESEARSDTCATVRYPDVRCFVTITYL